MLRARIDVATETVRRLATNLRPPALDHLGLAAAIELEAAAVARRTGLRCRVTGRLRTSSTPEETTAVFRIVQEALTNSLKHAAAEHVTVRIRYGDKLELEIRDDGIGDGNAAGGIAGSGLIGMRERVALLGGVLAAGATPGGGYRVSAEIPIDEAS